jgi:hypothetical protein
MINYFLANGRSRERNLKKLTHPTSGTKGNSSHFKGIAKICVHLRQAVSIFFICSILSKHAEATDGLFGPLRLKVFACWQRK